MPCNAKSGIVGIWFGALSESREKRLSARTSVEVRYRGDFTSESDNAESGAAGIPFGILFKYGASVVHRVK